VLLLDLLDGYLARQYKQSSPVGTYLDMECDAFFVWAVSFDLYEKGSLPLALLVPAAMRYIYVLIIHSLGLGHILEPKRKYASYIAGIYFTVLVASYILKVELMVYAQYLVGLAILASFGRSFLFALDHRATPR
jgi:phosphatidylglycerophosphate synthase